MCPSLSPRERATARHPARVHRGVLEATEIDLACNFKHLAIAWREVSLLRLPLFGKLFEYQHTCRNSGVCFAGRPLFTLVKHGIN
jgi:hypothetical protein